MIIRTKEELATSYKAQLISCFENLIFLSFLYLIVKLLKNISKNKVKLSINDFI